ncbi:MAG: fasciclin domain-containing protein [Ignavibacteriaceae bacterium]
MKNQIIILVAMFVFTSVSVFAQMDTKVVSKAVKNDIVQTAISAGNFTTLATALTEAGLVDALKGEGPFTVFAPTDEAFKKLPEGALDNLLKDKDALKNVLLYHVVSGNVTSKDVVKLDKATTLSGSDIKIKTVDSKVMINDSQVTGADVQASNGIIHVIDTVLLPPTK